jgi:anti-anti-sigma factor
MINFKADIVRRPDGPVVVLTGECDLSARDELVSTLDTALAQGGTVLVDLEGLTFLDSSGLNALINAHRTAVAAGRRVYVVNPNRIVATVLEITGIGDLLRPPPDLTDTPQADTQRQT